MLINPVRDIVIGVVGPCAAGKTTLIRGLRAAGWQAKHIAQEHSYVKDMWKRLSRPDFLIYLEVSYPTSLLRRQLNWNLAEYEEQLRRLEHARTHADLIIDTDALTPQEILKKVTQTLDRLSGNQP